MRARVLFFLPEGKVQHANMVIKGRREGRGVVSGELCLFCLTMFVQRCNCVKTVKERKRPKSDY